MGSGQSAATTLLTARCACESSDSTEAVLLCAEQPYDSDEVSFVQPELMQPLLCRLRLRRPEAEEADLTPKPLPWVPRRFEFVTRVQEMTERSGRVDFMRDLAGCRSGGLRVCVKRTPLAWTFSPPRPNAPDRPWHDVAILTLLNQEQCSWASTLHGVFTDGDHLYVVTSWASHGDLVAWSSSSGEPGHRREALLAPLAAQVVLAVRHLHCLGIAHRDISLENIVLDEASSGELTVRLIDFGMAAFGRWSRGSEVMGKVSYRAPEMHHTESYDTIAADAFAVGVAIFSAAANDYPWLSTKPSVCDSFTCAAERGFFEWLATRQLRGRRLSEIFSEPLVEVLRGLLHVDPMIRLTLGEPCLEAAGSPRRPDVRRCRWLRIKATDATPGWPLASPCWAREVLKLGGEMSDESTCDEEGGELTATVAWKSV